MGIKSKLKNYAPTHALFKLYYTLVHTHLLYGLIVWGNTYPTYLSKLIALQNKALRIVTKMDGIKMFCLIIKSLTY